jgi:hypothetical protein
VEVIAGIFTNGITEGFKTSATYGDVTDSSMKMPTESQRDVKRQLRTVTCPVCRQRSRRNHRRNSPSVKPSTKVNISPLTRLDVPLFLLLLPHLNSPQLQKTTAPPPKKKSPSYQHNKSYILKSSCHNIRVLIYQRIFISFCKYYLFKF